MPMWSAQAILALRQHGCRTPEVRNSVVGEHKIRPYLWIHYGGMDCQAGDQKEAC
jgi:hypothetical protein